VAHLLIVAGEASGDLLAAELLRELQGQDGTTTAVGAGGPALRAAGMSIEVPAEELAVVGLHEALSKVPVVLRALKRIGKLLDSGTIDQAVLVDLPDVNLPVARMAAARGIPVTYYVSPQVWAWRRGRLRTMARRVDQVLTLLPFEPELYRREGVAVAHVGHPLVERVAGELAGGEPPPLEDREASLVLLPGSRASEVQALWQPFLETARRVQREAPGTRLIVVRAPTLPADSLPLPDDLSVEVSEEPAARVIIRARCALVASGSATLECALCGTPHVVAYRVHPLTWGLGRLLVRGVEHIGLSNLIATGEPGGEPVAPEHLQQLDPQEMAAPIVGWMNQPRVWNETRRGLDRVRGLAGERGAPARAAAAVRRLLDEPPVKVPAVGARELGIVLAAAAALFVIRLVLAMTQPIHPDEAYFWRWSLAPAWGYFDQPPAVAWLIGAARALAGDTVMAVRGVAALCTAAAAVLVYLTVREHAGPRRAWAAPALLLAMPLVAVGGLVTTPDAPLMLAWAAFLYLATRAAAPRWRRAPPGDRWLAPWCLLGLVAGLGMLSKLTMVLAPAGLALWWLLRKPRPVAGPLLAAGLALGLMTPWLAWNAQIGFTPFTWEMSHGLHPQSGNAGLRLAEFLAAQAGMAGPLLLGAMAWFWVWGWRGEPHERLWTALSLPVLVGFGLASLAAPSNANWPAMAYPAAVCGLVVVSSTRLLWAAGLSSAALAAVGLVHLIVPLPVVPPAADPLADMAGYDSLAIAMAEELDGMDPGTVVYCSRYQDAAALSFAAGKDAPVFDRAGRGRPNQWDLWTEPAGDEALFISLNAAPDMDCAPTRTVGVEYRGEVVRTYVFYPCAPDKQEHAWKRPGRIF